MKNMTTQTKQYIDLTDIIAFRFDCTKCGATLSLPVSAAHLKPALNSCPHCDAMWASTPGRSHSDVILDFREALKKVQSILDKDYPAPLAFTMVLEVTGS